RGVDGSDGSHYSENESAREVSVATDVTEDPVTTPRAQTPTQANSVQESLPELKHDAEQSELSRDLGSFMLPEAQEVQEAKEQSAVAPEPEKIKMADAQEYLRRPFTPDQPTPLSKPEYDGSGWGVSEDEAEIDDEEPGTPDSVIHHPISDVEDEEPKES